VVTLAEWLQRRWRLGTARAAGLLAVLVLSLAVASLFAFNLRTELDGTALYFIGSYGLGMLAFWIGRIRSPWYWGGALLLLASLGAGALAWDWRIRIAVALVTALMLALAQRSGWLAAPPAWLGARPLLWLGRISYSLFLIHFPVILLVNALASFAGVSSPATCLVAMASALGLAIGSAVLLHRWVESRPASGRMTLSLMAMLLASGALVAA